MTVEEVYQLIDEGIITSGMIPKVLGCVEAIRNGVLAAISLMEEYLTASCLRYSPTRVSEQ